MKSTDLIDLLKEQISIEATDRILERAKGKLDDLLGDRIIINSQYLTIEKACEYLDVGRSTFYTLLKEHKPLKIMLGSSPRFAKSDLDKMFRMY